MGLPYFAAAIAIFIATMILVIRKPRNIAIGYSALIGAAASVAIGITPLHDLVDVWDIVWNPTFTFVGI
ncbi:MAG TPA: ArsB/NhaD family transporter, partial [Thermoplasmataceae archaeon]|nr:ArsB/NhaD family transporter [Thermoplasmataceae archaeon]